MRIQMSLLKDKLHTTITNGKPIFEFVTALVTICGWIIIAFTFGKDLMPGKELRDFTPKVSDLRLGQNYVFIEKKLGIPTIIEKFEYTTINNIDEQGSVATYYSNDYVILTYFDKNQSLFGYVVISDSKHFYPRIPSTLNSAKDGNQKLKNLSLSKVNPFNFGYSDWEPTLDHQYIFARSGSPDLERYYVEIYDMLNDGYLGVAITDINRESKSMDKVFKSLSDITAESSPFYKEHKNYFDYTTLFHMGFSNEAEEVQDKIYEIAEIDKENINSYFLFSKISNIKINSFLEDILKDHYFISKQKIIQLK